MDCCRQRGYDQTFDSGQARKDLERYRNDGPDPTTAALIAALRKAKLTGASLIDVGGGVGVIHHELLDMGFVANATQVDISEAYLDAAREEATQRGHLDNVRFMMDDFVTIARDLDLAPVDIVTLDRVICCYGDMESLVKESASRAKQLYGVVFPRDWWFLGTAFALINVYKWLTRSTFRVYLHPVADVDAAIRRQGLQPRTQVRTFVWNVWVYARSDN